jgi:hypothetical protein
MKYRGFVCKTAAEWETERGRIGARSCCHEFVYIFVLFWLRGVLDLEWDCSHLDSHSLQCGIIVLRYYVTYPLMSIAGAFSYGTSTLLESGSSRPRVERKFCIARLAGAYAIPRFKPRAISVYLCELPLADRHLDQSHVK